MKLRLKDLHKAWLVMEGLRGRAHNGKTSAGVTIGYIAFSKARDRFVAIAEELAKEGDQVKLDLGCGKNKREGYIGVDVRQFEGVDVVCDLGKEQWPWGDCTVDEVHASHFLEHLTPPARIYFANELHRVLKPGAKASIITPHWNSCRAYGDLTHEWPPVSEFWFPYLDKAWRATNAPHNDKYTCDFSHVVGYSVHPELQVRSQDHVMFALGHYREAAQDMLATLEKKR